MAFTGTQDWAQARADAGDGYTAWWSKTTKDLYYIARQQGSVIQYFRGTDGQLDTNFTNRATLAYVEWNELT